MSSSSVVNPEWVTDFAGENRVTPDHKLPANVSPDALNIDYQDRVISKRPGLLRRHLYGLRSGGMLVSDGRNGARYARLARTAALNFGPSAVFEYEFAFLFDQKMNPAATDTLEFTLFDDMNAGDTEGFRLVLRWNGTAWRLRLYVGNSSGTPASVDHSTNLSAHTTYVVRARHHPGTSDFSIDLNGTIVNGNYGANTFVYNTDSYIYFGTPTFDFTPNGLRVVIDDFRIWSGDTTTPIIDPVTSAKRAMTAAEVAAATGLLAYYKFDDTDVNGDWPSSGGTITGVVESIGTVVRSRSLVLGGEPSTITGISPTLGTPETGLIICTEDAIYRFDYNAGTLNSIHLLDTPSLTRWSFARHSNFLLMANGENQNLRYSDSLGVRCLSFTQPTAPFTATVSTTGGSFGGTGVVNYLYSFYDSQTGQESFVYPSPIPATLANATDKVTLSNFPITDQPGVTHYRIYRTGVDGAVYYYLADVPYANNVTYVDDNNPNPVTVGQLYNQYKGHAEPSLFLLEYNGYVIACNQDGATDRVRFTEPLTAGDFYFQNFLKVGTDSGDELTGGIVAGGFPVLFKRNSIWVMTGSGPSTFGVQKLFDCPGCVHHATIAASDRGIYYQSNDGVYLLPFPIGSAPPIDITENTQRTLFGALRDDERRQTYGIFDNIEQRYYTSLIINGQKRVLSFDHRTNAWALWSLDADTFAIARPDGGVNEVLVGRRGYVCRLDRDVLNNGLSAVGVSLGVTFTTNANNTNRNYVVSPSTLPNVSSGGPYQGLQVKLTFPSGTSEYAQVLYSDSTKLWFTSAVTGVGGAIPSGTVVTFEPIPFYWQTPRSTMGGALDKQKEWERATFLFAPGGSASLTVTLTGKDQSEASVSQTFTIATSARYARHKLQMRGDEVTVRLSGESADTNFSLCAFQLTYQERHTRP